MADENGNNIEDSSPGLTVIDRTFSGAVGAITAIETNKLLEQGFDLETAQETVSKMPHIQGMTKVFGPIGIMAGGMAEAYSIAEQGGTPEAYGSAIGGLAGGLAGGFAGSLAAVALLSNPGGWALLAAGAAGGML